MFAPSPPKLCVPLQESKRIKEANLHWFIEYSVEFQIAMGEIETRQLKRVKIDEGG